MKKRTLKVGLLILLLLTWTISAAEKRKRMKVQKMAVDNGIVQVDNDTQVPIYNGVKEVSVTTDELPKPTGTKRVSYSITENVTAGSTAEVEAFYTGKVAYGAKIGKFKKMGSYVAFKRCTAPDTDGAIVIQISPVKEKMREKLGLIHVQMSNLCDDFVRK